MNRSITFRYAAFVSALAVLLALSGCESERDRERSVIWSPDGQRAAVIGSNGLFFVDGDGKVLAPRLPGSLIDFAWFHDNQRLAVARSVPATSWKQVADILSKEYKDLIRSDAESIREQLMAYQGNLEKFLWESAGTGQEDRKLIQLYLRDEAPGKLPEKFGAAWNGLQKVEVAVWQLQLFSLNGDRLEPGEVISKSLDRLFGPRISPNEEYVAYMAEDDSDSSHSASLYAIPVSGGTERFLSGNVVANPAWSPDSSSLAYIVNSKDNVSIGVLGIQRVTGDNGALLDSPDEIAEKVILAVDIHSAIRWLSDGRLMFSSIEITLPQTMFDETANWSVFVFDPRTPSGVSRVIGRDFDHKLSPTLQGFEISPDGKRILLPGEAGQWLVYEFSTGKTVALLPPDTTGVETLDLASWRSNDEISLTVSAKTPDASYQPKDAFLIRDSKIRNISRNWPNEMK